MSSQRERRKCGGVALTFQSSQLNRTCLEPFYLCAFSPIYAATFNQALKCHRFTDFFSLLTSLICVGSKCRFSYFITSSPCHSVLKWNWFTLHSRRNKSAVRGGRRVNLAIFSELMWWAVQRSARDSDSAGIHHLQGELRTWVAPKQHPQWIILMLQGLHAAGCCRHASTYVKTVPAKILFVPVGIKENAGICPHESPEAEIDTDACKHLFCSVSSQLLSRKHTSGVL